jgi:NADH:ubiquinone oxidoreductase subunit 6 (subunit J)
MVAGWWLIHFRQVSPEAVLFYAFSGFAVVSAGLMITLTNPVHAALSFAMVVLSTCGLFLLLAAPFLMAATIIVYAGAIIVTFLFVIMLAQQFGSSSADQRSREPFLASLAGFVLLAALLYVVQRTYLAPEGQAEAAQFSALLNKARQGKDAESLAQLREIIGAGRESFFRPFLALLDSAGFLPGQGEVIKDTLKQQLDTAEEIWAQRDENWPRPEEKLAAMKRHLSVIYQRGEPLFARIDPPVLLAPDPGVPRSPFSTGPSRQPLRNEHGQVELPAENVASLGRTLFTDYLLAVEVAGFLLLVATIGAIVIASRRSEALR